MTKTIEKNINEQIQAMVVDSPMELAKMDYDEWFNTITPRFSKTVQFGTNDTIKIPLDVAIPHIKKKIFYHDNNTYLQSIEYHGKGKSRIPVVVIKKIINAIPYKIDLQVIISNNRTEEKPTATVGLVFKLDNEKTSKPFILDSRGKTKYSEFVLAANKSNNRLQFYLDDESFLLLMEKINQQKNETTIVFKNAGAVNYKDLSGRLYKNAYLDINGVIEANEDNIVKVNDLSIKLDDSCKDKLPTLSLKKIDLDELLKQFMLQTEKIYKNNFNIFLALGASIMTIYIVKIWEKFPGFPIIYLYGATKQGKSLIQGVISNFFGFSNKNVSMGNSTDNAIAMKCHRANAIPILINDFDYYKSQGFAFENNIVQFYEGGIREKMYDGSVMNRMPINTTAIFSSNYLPIDKPKVFNRLLPIYFPENGIETSFIDDNYVNNEARSQILIGLMRIPINIVLDKIKEVENWMLESNLFKIKDRESNNVAIAYTGVLLLELIAGYRIEDKEGKLKQYCEWYNNLFTEENTPVERFLNALPTLVNKSKLKKKQHYHAEIKDNKFLFTFDFATCLSIYNDFITDNGSFSNYLDKRMFGADLRSSKYFVEKGNHRFDNFKGQGHSYTLNITGHKIVPYLQIWATNVNDIGK